MHMPARFLDLHILQSVPAANLNRDGDNEPKTIQFGNKIRAFISSQSWKRELRLGVERDLDEPAARTRQLPPEVAQALRQAGWPEDLAAFAALQIARSATQEGLKTNSREGHRTQATLFLPKDATGELLALCEDNRTQLEEALTEHTASEKKKTPPAVLPAKAVAAQLTRRTTSISLFGRMLAELPSGHVEAAVQMAPAFTVHESDPQPDYFTTVEDWPQPGDKGSAHLQTAFLTTGIFYRYATLNITDFTRNLRGNTDGLKELIELFTWHFIMSLPQGKKTSTAPHTVPDLVHYAVRDSRPISYSAAFEQPVKAAPSGGYTAPARQALADYATTINRLVGTRRRIAHGHTASTPLTPQLGTHHDSFEDLAEACATAALTSQDRQ
ncbi:type I-E CRISPR-associated protein Cas7/Cse4/CasC [Streptomyces sp. IB2014 016-6]|uniref:type I-E CRISPR-associated protein Cas7/Cse4/CasC n=1 Tax=Streptomyces sp. IB2014 016-6 TaxID=2517818 RepID=UPI0011CBD988|nr:type I-E CRISPR-associated protein Cas7/Cse4/CasC [Streptomyces sp. IB2014 016-6]TXL84735.1 type I-E CRISPR-associated protein Cas7/Cse4/CasC [Streptomyces sp. IB2014 016-6]